MPFALHIYLLTALAFPFKLHDAGQIIWQLLVLNVDCLGGKLVVQGADILHHFQLFVWIQELFVVALNGALVSNAHSLLDSLHFGECHVLQGGGVRMQELLLVRVGILILQIVNFRR